MLRSWPCQHHAQQALVPCPPVPYGRARAFRHQVRHSPSHRRAAAGAENQSLVTRCALSPAARMGSASSVGRLVPGSGVCSSALWCPVRGREVSQVRSCVRPDPERTASAGASALTPARPPVTGNRGPACAGQVAGISDRCAGQPCHSGLPWPRPHRRCCCAHPAAARPEGESAPIAQTSSCSFRSTSRVSAAQATGAAATLSNPHGTQPSA